jgi:hypothetical protein
MTSHDNRQRTWWERNALSVITATLASLMALVIGIQVGC